MDATMTSESAGRGSRAPGDFLATRRHGSASRWWVDTALVQGLVMVATVVRFVDGYPTLVVVDLWAVGAVSLTLASVLLRTRAPWIFLATTTATNFAYTIDTPAGHPGLGLLVAQPFAVYAVASAVSLRSAIFASGGTAALLVTTALLHRGVAIWNIYPAYIVASTITSAAVGQVAYVRRRLFDSARRRAIDAERTREALAATRVAEQRLATARELHDVIGHQVAVINLHAGAAMRALPDRPDEAVYSLEIIQESAESVAGEMSELLQELRASDPGSKRTTGLEGLPGLIRTLEEGGFSVRSAVGEGVSHIPRELDVAAFRMLEEGLVNAYKHGSAGTPADATVEMHGEFLRIRITNATDDEERTGRPGGFGLLGIQEQARSLGGVAEVRVSDGVFDLQIEIPAVAT